VKNRGSPRLAARVLPIAIVLAAAAPPALARSLDPEEKPLPGAIQEILKSTPLERSRTSVVVQDIDSGETIYAYNADELLNPASNMKVLTTVAALALLGPQHRFRTDVLLDEDRLDERGVLAGDLHLRGRGDPSLDTERLYRLVRNLRHAGLSEVRGVLVVDYTYFD
jgi:D-alanyl-D-alanine carboxypeptidase/D-alanyl-D-alanine-endopeptidase (penicillin-binding protein 4)